MSQLTNYSKRYKRALTLAILLFLGTLTASILVMILASADRRSLEDDHRATLTAISTNAKQNTIQADGDVAFKATDPTYSAAESCDMVSISGLIRDLGGDLRNGISVRVWSDYAPEQQIIRSGEGPDAAPGRWHIAFLHTSSPLSRHVWVQIALEQDDGTLHYLSQPVEVTFLAGDCAKNHAEIVFEQVAPVE